MNNPRALHLNKMRFSISIVQKSTLVVHKRFPDNKKYKAGRSASQTTVACYRNN